MHLHLVSVEAVLPGESRLNAIGSTVVALVRSLESVLLANVLLDVPRASEGSRATRPWAWMRVLSGLAVGER